MHRRAQYISIIMLCLLSVGPCRAAVEGKIHHILIINSRQQGVPWTFAMMGSLQQSLLNADIDTELQIDYMHTARFVPGRSYFEKRNAVYAYEFHKYSFDCIIVVGEDALNYMLAYAADAFAKTPVIFCGVSMGSAAKVRDHPHYAVIASNRNLRRNIDLILRLCPWAKQVVFVHDQTSEGRALAADAHGLAPSFPALRLVFLTDLTMPDLIKKVQNLPHEAVLVLLPFTIDKEGEFYPPDVTIKAITAKSPVAAFGLWSFELNDGLTGGLVLDEHEYGRGIATAALQVARGDNVKKVSLPLRGTTHYTFDYRKLLDFGIDLSRLPQHNTLIHAPSNVLAEHRRGLLWVGSVAVVMLAVIGLLGLHTHRRRRSVEERLHLERETNEHKRSFYREILLSLTNDKLEICDYSEAQSYLNKVEVSAKLDHPADVCAARQVLRDYCIRQGMDEYQTSLLMMAVGEAANNVIKHASGGRMCAGRTDDQMWVAIIDQGTGIDKLMLPRVALQRGFSTKVSLGMGYTVMLDVSDRVLLATGDRGTTVVIFKHLHEPPKPPMPDLGGSLLET